MDSPVIIITLHGCVASLYVSSEKSMDHFEEREFQSESSMYISSWYSG